MPKRNPQKKQSDAIRFIDLFCGIGGFRLGFEKHGAECVFSSDWDKFSQQTYEANFGEKPHGDNAPQVIRLFNASKAYQKIEKFAKISNTTIKSAPFTITLPTSNSGLQVDIKVKGPASRSGNILTLSGKVGRVDLVATQLGNGNYHPASPVSTSFVVKAR